MTAWNYELYHDINDLKYIELNWIYVFHSSVIIAMYIRTNFFNDDASVTLTDANSLEYISSFSRWKITNRIIIAVIVSAIDRGTSRSSGEAQRYKTFVSQQSRITIHLVGR